MIAVGRRTESWQKSRLTRPTSSSRATASGPGSARIGTAVLILAMFWGNHEGNTENI